jgi:Mg-chelatase subunit ChlD
MGSVSVGSGPSGTGGAGGQLPPGGLLTAGAWDDNLNFDFFLKYQAQRMMPAQPGLPIVTVADRLTVLVQDGAAKLVPGATVIVSSNEREVARLRTGSDGRALVFPTWLGLPANAELTLSAEWGDGRGTTTAHAGDASATVSVTAARSALEGLDVALVIDTTGSMGDEIQYLQAETIAISDAIRAAYPQLSQRWAVIPYRDYQDEYVTRPVDFTDSLLSYQASLQGLKADGGGDYPEAPERGLADLSQLHWRSGAVARVAFWIADAPHHAEHTGDMIAALQAARTAGIHLYPIAASGADDLTEFTMRLGALVTGGRYLFLTNDSGIGNDHKEPLIPCYLVTTLQKAMLRMISMEVTGSRLDPSPADVIRTGGDPHDGRCTLNDGEVVDLL